MPSRHLRPGEGRKWRDGIHQAVEAKERITVTVPTGQAARITVQDLFLRYKYLAGMTGTAMSASREFRKVYHKVVVPVPTNRPAQRKRLPDMVFGTSDDKWHAIVQEIRSGFGPETADKMESLGKSSPNSAQGYLSLLKRAQRKVERRHLRDRFVLLYHEKERKKMQREMGQDPYLDTPD